MSDITPISGPAAPSLVGTQRQSKPTPTPVTPDRTDHAEFSQVARYLSKPSENPVRSELIDHVKGQIDQNSYVTSDKIDSLLDDLLSDLEV